MFKGVLMFIKHVASQCSRTCFVQVVFRFCCGFRFVMLGWGLL